jgi:hypothetical protein
VLETLHLILIYAGLVLELSKKIVITLQIDE